MQAKEILRKLTGKKHIYLVDRGNTAIKFLQNKYKEKTFLIPDQGGWLTYKNAKIKKTFKTNYGITKPLKMQNSILLINTMPGYFALQSLKGFKKDKTSLIINDASGSIGTKYAKQGDIILGSFGKQKPVNLNYGGFIAANFLLNVQENFNKLKLIALEKKLKQLPQRLKKLQRITKKIKKELKQYNILHKKHKAINIIVKFENEQTKNKIIKYCNNNNLQYTICPRYIRVNEKAISIEVKRCE